MLKNLKKYFKEQYFFVKHFILHFISKFAIISNKNCQQIFLSNDNLHQKISF